MENPAQLREKINTYSQQFHSVLDDFVKSYVNNKLYTDSSEYQQIYSNNMGIIQTLQANIFTLTNDVQKNIDTLNTSITGLDAKLVNVKKINIKLKKQSTNSESEGNGTDIMVSDSKLIYNNQYLTNISRGIGILIIFYLLFKIFSTK